MTIHVRIAHAQWDARRVAPLHALLSDLGHDAIVHSSTVKEHASVWATRLWRAAAGDLKATHTAFLNDDVRACRDFVAACEAITSAIPDEVVALHVTAPEASSVAPWLRSYWLTGPGYIIPRSLIPSLLEFVESWATFARTVNEDNLIMQWAWSRRAPIWHAVPALVRHDTNVPSTLGYDTHKLRQAQVTWAERNADITDPAYWAVRAEPPLIECPWMPRTRLARIEARHGAPSSCSFCGENPPNVESEKTGAGICRPCVGAIAAVMR
jgi:hypothetical protein